MIAHLADLTHTQLLAVALQYQHVLEHVVDENYHEPSACTSCQRMAQGALDRHGLEDFMEYALDLLEA